MAMVFRRCSFDLIRGCDARQTLWVSGVDNNMGIIWKSDETGRRKKMKRLGRVLVLGLVAVLLTAGASFATCSVYHSLMTPKYVFYFIGDGMGSPQIHSAEAYLAQVGASDGVDGSAKAGLLVMSQMPVQGMSTTFANNRFITDSAAAGTALACGMKTNVGVISMDATKTVSYKSLAEAAKEAGRKVGIVSSVSIDHATPAVFYAHEPSRNNY
jgi:alkaline phosphatase